ncbi:MAG: hypothetical protein WCD04_07205 [Terriglobia bacterium]
MDRLAHEVGIFRMTKDHDCLDEPLARVYHKKSLQIPLELAHQALVGPPLDGKGDRGGRGSKLGRFAIGKTRDLEYGGIASREVTNYERA